MAWTVAFALLGALIFSMVVAPVLSSFLFWKGAREWHNPVMVWITDRYRHTATWAIEHRYVTVGLAVCALLLAGFLGLSGVIGSEFLPHLDEGAIWVRGTLAPSTCPTAGVDRSLSIAPHATALGSFPSGVWIAGEVFTVEGAFAIWYSALLDGCGCAKSCVHIAGTPSVVLGRCALARVSCKFPRPEFTFSRSAFRSSWVACVRRSIFCLCDPQKACSALCRESKFIVERQDIPAARRPTCNSCSVTGFPRCSSSVQYSAL